jgi:hypothetical protein
MTSSEAYRAGWERIFVRSIAPLAIIETLPQPGSVIFECSKCYKKHPATSYLEWAPHHSPKPRVPDTITTAKIEGRYLFRCNHPACLS